MTDALQGFLLTRQWRERKEGLQFCYWVTTPQGPRKILISGQETVCFFPQGQTALLQKVLAPVEGWRIRDLSLQSFNHQPVAALYCCSMKGLQQCRVLLDAAGVSLWEADIRPVDRYLSERFITGELWLHGDAAGHILQDPQLQKSDRWQPALNMVSLDIETALDGSALYSIAVHAASVQQVWMIGKPRDADVPVIWCESEAELLQGFIDWMQDFDPDILIGWNVVNFDLKFLQRCCDRWQLDFAIGRNRELPEWRQARDESDHRFILVPGRVVLDGIDTLKAATWNFESFALESVAQELLGKGKLIQDVDDRGEEISRLFQQDKPALARYNLEDSVLVTEIFAKTGLLDFALERSRLTGLPLDKVGGSVAAFENLYLPRLHRAGYVAPNIGDIQSDIAAPGGFVMESRPGLYEHVLVLDFKSLYPSIIRTFRIDPLSLWSGLQSCPGMADSPQFFRRKKVQASTAESRCIPGFNGAVFSKQEHLLPAIIEQLWQARDVAKKAGNAPLSQAIKIIMNSFYGVLGTPLCRFFDPRLSSSITLRGHDILQQTRELIEQRGYPVIYGDTDSVFVWLQHLQDAEQAGQIGIELASYLNRWWSSALQEAFGIESALEIQYETHYRRFFMPTMRGSEAGSKKRYAGLVRRGTKEELVFKGLENVRTDWTPLARRVQFDVFWRVFHNQDVEQYLHQVANQLREGQLDDELVYRKRIRQRLSAYRKNVPPHVQAARKADLLRQERGREMRYKNGGWVAYFMTLNGPEPAEFRQSALDYEHYLQRQLAPAVDGILQCQGRSLDGMLRAQLSLF